ncbi:MULTISPECIES: hypothetical protein [Halomonadaceae]|uniref:hypothetical protein n=1 Tax=Halomonadaceae TaxID=28256 RepID=UPI0015998AEE|nr:MULTISPECIES: hypothetical protein [Halomonas]QJQ93904.1 hypothetical protein HIO72_00410 [Halomonas sp. PA5]
MALGLLAGAIAGGGQAVQENARSRIDELKQMRLKEMDQKYQTSEREASQDFTAGENQNNRQHQTSERLGGQQFTSGENQANRQSQRELTGMQVGAANQRANAGGWQLVPTDDGGMMRYNTITGETAEAPQGLLASGITGGKMSDREKDAMATLRSQYRDLAGQYDSMGDVGEKQQVQERLNRVYSQMERINPLLAREIAGEADGGGIMSVDDFMKQFQ